MLYDKFEKVEDSDGDSEVLDEHLDHAEVPGELLDLWAPGALASERAVASGPGLRRSRTQKAFAPLAGRLFAGKNGQQPCTLKALQESIGLKFRSKIAQQYTAYEKEDKSKKRLKMVLQSKKVRFDDEDMKRKRKAL
jgi:hypothetical protein